MLKPRAHRASLLRGQSSHVNWVLGFGVVAELLKFSKPSCQIEIDELEVGDAGDGVDDHYLREGQSGIGLR